MPHSAGDVGTGRGKDRAVEERTAGGVVVVVVEYPAVEEALARVLLDEAVIGGGEGAAGVESGCSEKCRLHLRGVGR